jgi:aromatic-amino-acid transaminase
VPLIGSVGLEIVETPFYDRGDCCVRFDEMMAALDQARPGDLVLVHGCCPQSRPARTFRPTSGRRWPISSAAAASFLSWTSPIRGSATGWSRMRAAPGCWWKRRPGARRPFERQEFRRLPRPRRLAPRQGADADIAQIAYSNLLVIARTIWSMPPDHGAAVVRIVLDTPDLAADWHAELQEMCGRIRSLRARLAAFDSRLAYIDGRTAMFSMLPLTPDSITELRES